MTTTRRARLDAIVGRRTSHCPEGGPGRGTPRPDSAEFCPGPMPRQLVSREPGGAWTFMQRVATDLSSRVRLAIENRRERRVLPLPHLAWRLPRELRQIRWLEVLKTLLQTLEPLSPSPWLLSSARRRAQACHRDEGEHQSSAIARPGRHRPDYRFRLAPSANWIHCLVARACVEPSIGPCG